MFLSPIGGDFLGDSATASTWTSRMKGLGAEISAFPNDPKPLWIEGKQFPRTAAVFRRPEVWVPLVNARTLAAKADRYSSDGRTAYYLAPDDVQRDFAKRTDAASTQNAIPAGKELEAKWWDAIFSAPRNAISGILGIPPWLVTLGIVAGAAYAGKQLLDTFGVFRRNPGGRRRRRRRGARR